MVRDDDNSIHEGAAIGFLPHLWNHTAGAVLTAKIDETEIFQEVIVGRLTDDPQSG